MGDGLDLREPPQTPRLPAAGPPRVQAAPVNCTEHRVRHELAEFVTLVHARTNFVYRIFIGAAFRCHSLRDCRWMRIARTRMLYLFGIFGMTAWTMHVNSLFFFSV